MDQIGVRPYPKKIKSVQEFPKPKPKIKKNIKQFLGISGNFSKIASSLTH